MNLILCERDTAFPVPCVKMLLVAPSVQEGARTLERLVVKEHIQYAFLMEWRAWVSGQQIKALRALMRSLAITEQESEPVRCTRAT